MNYTVVLQRKQRKELEALPADTRSRIESALLELETNPRPANCKKLVAQGSAWRISVGDYRVVYEIGDSQLLIFVIRIAHRREVYR